ncbi:MAG: hypothetical protein PVJ72_04370 [Gammaproteobacteria bacterium]|jgi:hypothetical protein
MSHFFHTKVSQTNDSRHNQHLAVKHWSLIPEIVMVLALAWFSFDLAFRLDGYQEARWMFDLDMLAVLVLIVGAGFLALRYHAQSAERMADEFEGHKNSNPRSQQFHVSDGGMGLPTQKPESDKVGAKKPGAYFDGGTFPSHKRR